MLERDASFEECRIYFTTTFVPEREKVIKDLTHLKNEIQQEIRLQKTWSFIFHYPKLFGLVCAMFGLLNAPSTGWGFWTTLGIFIRILFGNLSFIHEDYRKRNVAVKLGYAVRFLKNHDKIVLATNEHLYPMNRQIESLQDEISDIQQTKDSGEKILETNLVHVPENFPVFFRTFVLCQGVEMLNSLRFMSIGNEDRLSINIRRIIECILSQTVDVSQLSVKTLFILVSAFMVEDFSRLACDDIIVWDFKKGRLCAEAESLNSVIERIEYEFNFCRQWF